MEDKEKPKNIYIISQGECGLSLLNLTEKEKEYLEGMVNNNFWVTVTDGRLEMIPRREELPPPAKDETMMPFWMPENPPKGKQVKLFEVDVHENSGPSIHIQHLCGYYFTPENYKIQAELLESYGFSCLRSRRGTDGLFDEVWLLSSLWSAEGELKEVLTYPEDLRSNDKKGIDAAVSFLCRKTSFGTLDIAFQRASMPIPD